MAGCASETVPLEGTKQKGKNSLLAMEQVGYFILYKRPFAILRRTLHDLLSLGFSLEWLEGLSLNVLICKSEKKNELCVLAYRTLHKALMTSNSLHGFDFITLNWAILLPADGPRRPEQEKSDCVNVQMDL